MRERVGKAVGKVVLIQQIKTSWTKASRGGENARKRNAVPEVAKVPVQRIPADNLILVHHLLSYGEDKGFSKPAEEIHVTAPQGLKSRGFPVQAETAKF